VIHREQGPPWPAERTLRERRGACRDLAVLFNDVCRFVGFPARFVSGYQVDVPEEARPELHAWSEVYLPGAGWRGFDPSQGLAVADRHVPLAASRTPWMASPTSGTYRGTARSTLTASVQFRSPEWAASA
jgi:transglutaminase-like putative cysteine protease